MGNDDGFVEEFRCDRLYSGGLIQRVEALTQRGEIALPEAGEESLGLLQSGWFGS